MWLGYPNIASAAVGVLPTILHHWRRPMSDRDQTLTAARFSERIRTATWGQHGDAESSPYMDALMDGRLDRDQYAALVGQLWFVYRELEATAGTWAGDTIVAAFLDERLDRRSRLEADLAVLLGAGWRSSLAALPETEAYVARLEEVGASWGLGLVAHHYTRYLGDLSGGQFIGRVVREVYGLDRDRGASFYAFEIPEPGAWKESYRRRLDELELDEAEAARTIDEVREAYRLNTELLAGLGRQVLGER